jgi:hypothetical protein
MTRQRYSNSSIACFSNQTIDFRACVFLSVRVYGKQHMEEVRC